MHAKRIVVFLGAFLFLGATGSASAAPISVGTDQIAAYTFAQALLNHGRSSTREQKGTSQLTHGMMEFPLTGLTIDPGEVAMLELVDSGGTTAAARIDIYSYRADGVASVADFEVDAAKTLEESNVDRDLEIGTYQFFDVTVAVHDALNAGASHVGFLFTPVSNGDSQGNSREFRNFLTVVPLPAAAWMLLGALGLLAARQAGLSRTHPGSARQTVRGPR